MRFARAGASSFTNKPYPEDADSWEDMIAPIRAQLDASKEENKAEQSSVDVKPAKSSKKEKNKRKRSLSGETDESKLLKTSGTIDRGPNTSKSLVQQSPPDVLDKSKASKSSKRKDKVHKSKEGKTTSEGLPKQCSPAKNSLPSPVKERTKNKHIRTSSGSFAVCNFVSDIKRKSDSFSESDNGTSPDSRDSDNKTSPDSPVRDSPNVIQKSTTKLLKIKPKVKSAKSDSSSESDSDSSEDSEASVDGTSGNQNKLQSALLARTENQYSENKAKSKTNNDNKTKPKTNNDNKAKPKTNKARSKTNNVAGGRVSGEGNCVRFGRHIISKEAFKEITELKLKWKEEGRPDDVIEEAVKLRARRDEKIRKHRKQKMANATCYACQQTGHVIADCPQVAKDGASSSNGMAGICYTCGSTEHNSKECRRQTKREKKQVFSLATCFRCNKSGHIARQCEENACFTCGQHGHIQRHCPKAGTGVKNMMDKQE